MTPFPRKAVACAASWVMLGLLGACADEASRESYLVTAVTTTCTRLEECGKVGEERAYLTTLECRRSIQPLLGSLWPPERCTGPQIDFGRFTLCDRWLDVFPCDSNLLESPSLSDVCGADRVCTRPPNSE